MSKDNLEQNSGGSDSKARINFLDAGLGKSIASSFDWSTVAKGSDTPSFLPIVDVPTDGDSKLNGDQLVKLEPGVEVAQKQDSNVKIDIESTSPSVLRDKINNGEVVGKNGDITELKIKMGKGETTVYKVTNGSDSLYYDKDNVLIAREGPLGNDGKTAFQTIRDDAYKTARGALEFKANGKLDREIRFDKDGRANGMWDGNGREIYFPKSKAPSITYGSKPDEAAKITDSYLKLRDYRSNKK